MPTQLVVLKIAVGVVVGIGMYVWLCRKVRHTPTWLDAFAVLVLGSGFYSKGVIGFFIAFLCVRFVAARYKRSLIAGPAVL